MTGKADLPYRPAVGVMLLNREGKAFVGQRLDSTLEAWQLPQGGLDESEEPLHAAFREVAEETGIPESALELVRACQEPLAYELPMAARRAKTGRGQALYWFLFRFRGSDDLVDVTRGGEFRAWRWMAFPRVIEGVADFRKAMYRRLASEFERDLARRV